MREHTLYRKKPVLKYPEVVTCLKNRNDKLECDDCKKIVDRLIKNKKWRCKQCHELKIKSV